VDAPSETGLASSPPGKDRPAAAGGRRRRGSGRDRILEGALQAFCEVGYQATSVRDIAQRSGVSVPGLYHHFTSKYEILLTLIRRVMNDLIAETSQAVEQIGPDPLERLGAAVEAHVKFHTERQQESFLGNTELRSLEPDERAEIVALRDRQQAIFTNVIAEGAAAGRMHVGSVQGAARAIVTMCTAVASWYRPGGALNSESVAGQYRSYALAIVTGHVT
jgi:AcrR family transcriptional regulator